MKDFFKLSIIIPIYNVENYIERCISSIYKSKLPPNDFEVIVVDDESPDNSINIIKRHQHKIKNITIISQKNKGLGGARNTGLKNAKGKYVFFFDSDDFIITPKFDLFFQDIYSSNVDVGIGDFYDYYNKDYFQPSIFHLKNRKPIEITGKECIQKYYRKNINTMVWRNIYKKEHLLNNKLFFNEGIFYEDVNWTPKVLALANRIKYIPIYFYNYVQRSGSIINSTYSEKKFHDRLYVNKDLLLFASQLPIEEQKEFSYLAIIGTFVAIGKIQTLKNIDAQIQQKIINILLLPCSNYLLIRTLIYLYKTFPKFSNYILYKYYGR